MIAYKFRSSHQIEFIFDIIINQRLYCADWKRLNDPMEGMFTLYRKDLTEGTYTKSVMGAKGVVNAKRKYKICSLSRSLDNFLLWSHYANGYNGVAIEVELPDDDNWNIRPVTPRELRYYLDLNAFHNEDEAARAVLFSKYKIWEYEQEIRILHESEWYEIPNKVKRVIVGHKTNPTLTTALKIVCRDYGISCEGMEIGKEGFQTIPI